MRVLNHSMLSFKQHHQRSGAEQGKFSNHYQIQFHWNHNPAAVTSPQTLILLLEKLQE